MDAFLLRGVTASIASMAGHPKFEPQYNVLAPCHH